MQDMAVVAGNIIFLVLAGIPERKVTVALMTRETHRRFLVGGNGFVVEAEDATDAAAATRLSVVEGVGVAGLAVRALQVSVLTVFGCEIIST